MKYTIPISDYAGKYCLIDKRLDITDMYSSGVLIVKVLNSESILYCNINYFLSTVKNVIHKTDAGAKKAKGKNLKDVTKAIYHKDNSLLVLRSDEYATHHYNKEWAYYSAASCNTHDLALMHKMYNTEEVINVLKTLKLSNSPQHEDDLIQWILETDLLYKGKIETLLDKTL